VGTGRSPAPGAVGLIGLGEIGQVHAAAVRQSRAARLVAVADTVPDLLAPFQAQGIRGYRDAGELIADAEVGTVSVCLPHYLHLPVTLEAIRAGKHVLVEKPLAISVAEGQQMVDAAAAAGVALGVPHNQVFYAAHAEAKRLIDTGAIGRPVFIRLRLGAGPLWGGWRDSPDLAGGGLRPNVVIRTAAAGFTENDWLERILRVGDDLVLRVIARTPRCAVPTLAHGALPRDPDALRVLARHNRVEPLDSLDPEPCAGVYAEVLRPGHIRTGDPVRLA